MSLDPFSLFGTVTGVTPPQAGSARVDSTVKAVGVRCVARPFSAGERCVTSLRGQVNSSKNGSYSEHSGGVHAPSVPPSPRYTLTPLELRSNAGTVKLPLDEDGELQQKSQAPASGPLLRSLMLRLLRLLPLQALALPLAPPPLQTWLR